MKRLLLALLLVAPTPAHAFIVLKNWNGQTERWSSPTVTWTMSTTVMDDVPFANLQAALTAAFQSWEDVSCSRLDFTYGGQKAQDPNNGIHITFRTQTWDPSVADALAYSVSDTSAAGTIVSNDIVFNAVDVSWSTSGSSGANDIQGVATHEIGHSFGLDHARSLAATMFFSGGETGLRSLDEDDTRGACFLYPTSTFTGGRACDACESNAQCAGGACLDWGEGHAYCATPCGADFACDAGFGCYNVNGVANPVCLPDNDGDEEVDYCHGIGRNVPLGGFCFGNEVCASGQCLALGDTAYCTQSCNPQNRASCGAGFACVEPGLCLAAGTRGYGERCTAQTDCASATCVFFSFGSGVCTTTCTRDSDCGGGQCFEGSVCVPPGIAGVGTPCSAPDQCAGTYCEDGLCTARCDAGCPRGTTCENGFCQGAELGASCSLAGKCPDGLTCLRNGDERGTCERLCDPLTDSGCDGGDVCAWAMLGTRVSGRCTPANGGRGVGESCADQYCEADLVCRFRAGVGPVCHRDCRTDSGFGCLDGEDCVAFDEDVPLHGMCVPEVDEPAPDPDPGDAWNGDTGDTTSPVDPADTLAPVDAGPEAEVGPPSPNGSGGGCAGGPGLGLPLLGLLALARRRR